MAEARPKKVMITGFSLDKLRKALPVYSSRSDLHESGSSRNDISYRSKQYRIFSNKNVEGKTAIDGLKGILNKKPVNYYLAQPFKKTELNMASAIELPAPKEHYFTQQDTVRTLKSLDNPVVINKAEGSFMDSEKVSNKYDTYAQRYNGSHGSLVNPLSHGNKFSIKVIEKPLSRNSFKASVNETSKGEQPSFDSFINNKQNVLKKSPPAILVKPILGEKLTGKNITKSIVFENSNFVKYLTKPISPRKNRQITSLNELQSSGTNHLIKHSTKPPSPPSPQTPPHHLETLLLDPFTPPSDLNQTRKLEQTKRIVFIPKSKKPKKLENLQKIKWYSDEWVDLYKSLSFVKNIGHGAFAKVYKAIDLSSGCEVAVKVLDKKKIVENNWQKLAERELEILSVIHHKCIPEFYRMVETPTKVNML
jgi:Protein kinase domain